MTPHYKPTLNQQGYMLTQIDPFTQEFIDYAASEKEGVFMDVGPAYGIATLAILHHNKQVIAIDPEPRHLKEIEEKCPEDQKHLLTLIPGFFPQDVNLEPNSLRGILISRVFHFFTPEQIQESIKKVKDLLEVNGKIFVLTESPFFGTLRDFLPVYWERKQKGDLWPGFMDDIKYFDPERASQVSLPLNFFDLKTLHRIFYEQGFFVEKVSYVDRQGIYPEDALLDGRESVYIVAHKR